jgi:hypothetical protein
MRCEQYGHTKSFCNRPYVCVKCGGPRSTQLQKKKKNTPAKCIFCGGAHPANYRGCEYYHRLLKKPNNRLNIKHNTVIQIQHEQIKLGLSYSDALKRKSQTL